MVKIYSLILTFFILTQSFSFNFINTLSDVVMHANFHKENYGDSLYTFIAKHYGDLKESHQQKHQEEEEHQKHKHPLDHDCDNHSVKVFVVENLKKQNDICLEGFYSLLNCYNPNLFSTFEKQKIFQPPRLS